MSDDTRRELDGHETLDVISELLEENEILKGQNIEFAAALRRIHAPIKACRIATTTKLPNTSVALLAIDEAIAEALSALTWSDKDE